MACSLDRTGVHQCTALRAATGDPVCRAIGNTLSDHFMYNAKRTLRTSTKIEHERRGGERVKYGRCRLSYDRIEF